MDKSHGKASEKKTHTHRWSQNTPPNGWTYLEFRLAHVEWDFVWFHVIQNMVAAMHRSLLTRPWDVNPNLVGGWPTRTYPSKKKWSQLAVSGKNRKKKPWFQSPPSKERWSFYCIFSQDNFHHLTQIFVPSKLWKDTVNFPKKFPHCPLIPKRSPTSVFTKSLTPRVVRKLFSFCPSFFHHFS